MRRCIVILVCAGSAVSQEQPPAPVVVAPVVEREIVARRSFVGTVQPSRLSTVGSESAGLVVEYLVREGDRVEKGRPLAKLRTKLAEIRLSGARATLDLRAQELAELVNGSRKEEIEQARARVRRADIGVEVRQWKLSRARELVKTSVISEDELNDARLLAQQAEEDRKVAVAAFELVEAGPRKEKIDQARARVHEQEAEVARQEDVLERLTIHAPFDGYVVKEHSEVGQWLDQGAPVADIAALDRVDVLVPILEDYVRGVRVGMEVPVTVDSLPGRRLTGRLHAIVPTADPRARTFPVKIRLENPSEDGGVLLKGGMFASIHVPIGRKERALVVPKDALVLGGPQPVVFVVKDGVAQPVPVKAGISVDSLIQVTGAIAAGDLVVVRGNERLRPGHSVRVTETLK